LKKREEHGITDSRLEKIETLSMAAGRLWSIFWEIKPTKRGDFGGAGITWPDIESWSRMNQSPIEVWEANALIRMDLAREEVLAKKHSKEMKAQRLEAKSRAMERKRHGNPRGNR
jgi:hypothetical protein